MSADVSRAEWPFKVAEPEASTSITDELEGLRLDDDEPTEVETVIACLGDDAAKLREANPDDEMAANMDAAARLLEQAHMKGAAS